MKIKLIDGHFTAKDAVEIITQMIHVKIKFQESKISSNASPEDLKMRERRIKQLQKDLYELRKNIDANDVILGIDSNIEISFPDDRK